MIELELKLQIQVEKNVWIRRLWHPRNAHTTLLYWKSCKYSMWYGFISDKKEKEKKEEDYITDIGL